MNESARVKFVTQPFDGISPEYIKVPFTSGVPPVWPPTPKKYLSRPPLGWTFMWPPVLSLLPRPTRSFDAFLWKKYAQVFNKIRYDSNLSFRSQDRRQDFWHVGWQVFVRLGFAPLDWFEYELTTTLIRTEPQTPNHQQIMDCMKLL